MKFCSECGAPLERRVPEGEDRIRYVCPACGAVHYQNPRLVVGCVVEQGEQVLLCQRAIEPRAHLWTLPAGFLELHESTVAGAIRETHEEAHATCQVLAPLAHLDIPHIGQAYVLFRARLSEPGYGPGPESLAVEMVGLDAIPWEELAFPVVRFALQLYVDDCRQGLRRVHHGVVLRQPDARPFEWGGYQLHQHLAVDLA
jgi:ADP-ribose/FAD diphosphatase